MNLIVLSNILANEDGDILLSKFYDYLKINNKLTLRGRLRQRLRVCSKRYKETDLKIFTRYLMELRNNSKITPMKKEFFKFISEEKTKKMNLILVNEEGLNRLMNLILVNENVKYKGSSVNDEFTYLYMNGASIFEDINDFKNYLKTSNLRLYNKVEKNLIQENFPQILKNNKNLLREFCKYAYSNLDVMLGLCYEIENSQNTILQLQEQEEGCSDSFEWKMTPYKSVQDYSENIEKLFTDVGYKKELDTYL